VSAQQPPARFAEAAEAYGIEFDPGDLDKIGEFLSLLLEANTRFNLTAVTDPDEAWVKHVFDSLTLLPYVVSAEAGHVIDVGSGGGLPGVPLALTMPEVDFTLLEATGKKADFLRDVAERMDLANVDVISDRAETIAHDCENHREQYDLVVARAVGRLVVLAELAGRQGRQGDRRGGGGVAPAAQRGRRDDPHAHGHDRSDREAPAHGKALSAAAGRAETGSAGRQQGPLIRDRVKKGWGRPVDVVGYGRNRGSAMARKSQTWIFVVDNGRGRLLKGAPAPRGRFHLELDDSIENTGAEHEHGRPSPLTGREGHSYASRGHEDEERMKRFARAVASWLEEKTRRLDIDRLALFAPPRFLGALRQAWSPRLAVRVDEHEGDLGYMAPGDLARHRSISRLLDREPGF
jgi:16S rRNA (guanine(527)-N(7))-methyltransferase RsmG